MRYIEELQEGETIVEHYLCKSRQSLKSKNGKTYLSLKLQDKTGIADAKVWEMNRYIQSFAENDFIKIEALVTIYNGEIQLNVKKLRRSNEGEYDPKEYVPTTKKDVEQMHGEFIAYIDTIENFYMKTLLQEIFLKNKQIKESLKTHSAAKTMHHNYLGGLLEHLLSVTKICDALAKHYEYVDRDILITTAMLHDVAKMMELSHFPDNDYTDDGQLLGHIYMGAELIGKTAQTIPNFPPQLESLLKHSLLSHHGTLEYGSPKTPQTIEAHLLSCADNMDAKVKMYEELVEEGDKVSGNWKGYSKMLQRSIRDSKY